MSKKSSLFNYITWCLQEKNTVPGTNWQAKLLTSEKADKSKQKTYTRKYYVLYNPKPNMNLNPFASIHYGIDNSAKQAHISVDKYFYSENSLDLNRRNLSYCHGTEYFIPPNPNDENQNIITVHYYFNLFGEYIHASCKDANGNKLTISIQQELILAERAKDYGVVIRAILKQKSQKYLNLCDEIELGKDEITIDLHKGKINQAQLHKKITHYTNLNDLKNKISDYKLDQSTSFNAFVQVVNKLMELKQEPLATNKPAVEEELEDTQYATNDFGATSALTIAKNHNNPTEYFKDEIKAYIKQLEALTKLSKKIKFNSTAQQVEDYLHNFNTLHANLLILSFKAPQKHQTQTNKLFRQLESLQTPEKIFANALEELNLAHIQATFTYCSYKFTCNIFHDIVNNLLSVAYDGDIAETLQIKQITDFLHENCESFRFYIQNISNILFETMDQSTISTLGYISLISNKELSKEIFSALLAYGADPNISFERIGDSYIYAPMFMINNQFTDDYYLKELMKYGMTFYSPAAFHMHVNKIPPSSATIRKFCKDVKNRLNELSPIIKNKNNIVNPATILYNPKQLNNPQIQCPFVNLTILRHNNPIDGDDSLYETFAKYCPLSSLLFSAAFCATQSLSYTLLVPNSKQNGLICVEDLLIDKANELASQTLTYNLAYIIQPSSKGIKFINIILKAIQQRFTFISAHDLQCASIELQDYITLFNNCSYSFSNFTLCYMSANFLYCLKGNLSEIDMATCIENLFNSALADMHEIKRLKNNLNLFLKNTKNDAANIQQEILNFKNTFNNLHELAFSNFWNTMRLAYSSPYPNNSILPMVSTAFQHMTSIINNDKLPSELKEKLLEKYVPCERLYMEKTKIMNNINATPQIASEANKHASTHKAKIKF
jgi:hypothetical protein